MISSRYLSAAELDRSALSLAFRTIMLIAHFSALCSVLLSPALVAIVLRGPSWLVVPLGLLCSTATLAALLLDSEVYQLYRFHINAGVMNLLLGGAALETFELSNATYVQAFETTALVVAAQSLAAWLSWRHVQRHRAHPRFGIVVTGIFVTAIVVFHSTHIWADAHAYEPLLEQTDILPLRYAATAKRSLRALGVKVPTQPTWRLETSPDRSSLAYPLYPLSCRSEGDPPNIIVILIDSWRLDALNAHATPNLEAFARRSQRFADHHSGGNATRIGVFSLFYSIPGTYWHRMLAERQGPVFMTELLRRGYDIRAFRSAPLFSPEFDRTVFAQVSNLRMRSDGEDAVARDRDLTEDFLAFISSRANAGPFFALLFYDSPHKLAVPRSYPSRFRPSASDVNYLRLHNATDPLPLLNRYLNSVHYVDSLIGRVLAGIEAQGLLDNSVIVVTGDHGQEFNDNGRNYWGHGSNFTRHQTGVPLLIYSPDAAPAIYHHRTTHFDVMPTLLRTHLGCDEPFSSYSVGRPLSEPGGRETLVLSEYADFAIVTADRIAVVREQGMQVLDASYGKLENARLDPGAIATALEQRSRFYRRARLSLHDSR